MKNDYYFWFLIIFIAVCSCIICYGTGYDKGYRLGETTSQVIIPQDTER